MYIREAHPTDGWQLDDNVDEGVLYEQPTSWAKRRDIATTCKNELALGMLCLVDDLDNSADELYAAWPERLYVIDRDGRIAYAGGRGPFGFSPEELGTWLNSRFEAP